MFHSIVQIPELKFTYKLTIENISDVFKDKMHMCPSFCFGNETWTVGFFKANTSLSVKLYRFCSKEDVMLKSQVSVSDYIGRIVYDESVKENFYGLSLSMNVGRELAVLDEFCLETVENYLGGTLINITVDLVLIRMVIKELHKMPLLTDNPLNCRECVCSDILKMYENNVHTDVVLTVQGEEIHVHKAVLCARSPVFDKMFQQELTETAKSVVDVGDINMAAMKELVDFMYSRVKLNDDFDTAVDVYYATDKYEVLKLRETCSLVILQNLDEDNSLQVLQMSDRHKDVCLKEAVMKFINSNFKACVKAGWWADFAVKRSDLYEELMSYIT